MANSKTYLTRVRKFHQGITPDALEDEFDNLTKSLNKIVAEIISPLTKQTNEITGVINNSVRLNAIEYNGKVYNGYEPNYIIHSLDVNVTLNEDIFLTSVSEGDILSFIHFPRKQGFVAVSSDLTFKIFDSEAIFFTGEDIGIDQASSHDQSIWKVYTQNDVIYYRFDAETSPLDTGAGTLVAVILKKPNVKNLTIQPINVGVSL